MTVRRIDSLHWSGLSADSKPTDVPNGSEYWAYDTNIIYKTYDGTNWVPTTVVNITQASAEAQSFHQAAASYPLFTATGGSVFVQEFTLTNTVNHSADAGAFAGISVETDSATVIILVSAVAGAKANLTAAKVFTYSTPFTLLTGKKVNYTIIGGETAADPAGFTVTCRYQPINPAGYLA
jgi:hypothetical protein